MDVALEIISNTTDFYLEKETAVAIGKFDGVHIGHRRLLSEILAKKKQGLLACVFTFHPAPAVFFGRTDGMELTTRMEKRRLFEQMGIDILIEFPLNEETAKMPPEEFVTDILVDRMHMQFMAAGRDVSFGNKGAGNVALLQKMGEEIGFSVQIIDKIKSHDTEVSSSYIRSRVEAGEMNLAEELLGTPYSVLGKVVHGNQIGRTLGFPTVNLLPEQTKLLPPNGVYYSKVRFGRKTYFSITNIGYKPTVTNEKVKGVESYLYDFSQEIYEEEIEVLLYDYKRPEQRFEGMDALRSQLRKDIEEGRKYFCKV